MDTLAVLSLKNALNISHSRELGDSHTVVQHHLQQHSAELAQAEGWQSWPAQRQTVLCLQLCCKQAGLQPGLLDGWWGPQTSYAAEQLAGLQQHQKIPPPWRDRYSTPANPNNWPLDREQELRAFFGDPGEQLVKVSFPYPMRLAWDMSTTVLATQCHQKVAASVQKVLEQVLLYYGFDAVQQLRLDLYGGGFNLRARRGGSSLSTHSWGIAFDFDPEHNQLKWGSNKAAFARSDYGYWWQCWEDEGWVSLGRSRNYDWMHVQAARL